MSDHARALAARKARIAAQQKVPFLDDTMMDDTPPDCSFASFKEPKLRRSPFKLADIDWEVSNPINGGMDGFVWKVWFGQKGPSAMKVLWDTMPFEDWAFPALQRECQNVALLQMIATSLERAKKECTPIMGYPDPSDNNDAKHNLDSFADEYRTEDKGSKLRGEVETVSAMPRMARCHGWLKFTVREYVDLVPRRKRAPALTIDRIHRGITGDDDREYVAIVYEWVEPGHNDLSAIEGTCRFFWLAGFSWNDSYIMMQNWHQGILIDHADIIHPRGLGWHRNEYGPREAKDILERMTDEERQRHEQG